MIPHAGIGYDVLFSWGTLEPFVSLDYAVTFQPAFTETGAYPLNMSTQSATPSLLRSQVGLNVYEMIDNCAYVLVFEQSASYVNKKSWGSDSTSALALAATLSTAPSPLTLAGYSKTLNLYSVGADIFYKHKASGFFISGAYAGEFGTGYMSNNVQGTLGWFF